MQRSYDSDVVFLKLNVSNGGINQGWFLKEQMPEIILIDYSDKGYLRIQDVVRILG